MQSIHDYQEYLELVNGLEAVRRCSLKNTSLVKAFAQIMYEHGSLNLEVANAIIESQVPDDRVSEHIETELHVTTEFLIEKIRPWIEDVRQTLFHSREAPFSQEQDAKRWCEEALEKEEQWHKQVDEWMKKSDEWGKHLDAFHEKYPFLREDRDRPLDLKGIPLSELPSQAEFQEIHDEYGELEKVKPPETPRCDSQVDKSWALYDELFKIYRATGFTGASMKMHILANVKPVLPPIKLHTREEVTRLPSGIDLVNPFITLTIRSELSFEQLRSVYHDVRRELKIKRTKPYNEKHLELYRMVQERGGAPRGKGTVAFWESVKTEINKKREAKDRYKDWRAPKQAYERLMNKLNALYLSNG